MVSSVEFWKVISYYKKENPVVKIACLSCFPFQKGEGRFLKCFLIESDVALLIREQLPFLFASTIDQNRGNKATLLRSPDRVIGLAGATRQISRTRTFGLSEAMAFAYVKEPIRPTNMSSAGIGCLVVSSARAPIGSTNGLLLT
jgi:hypothetical protein